MVYPWALPSHLSYYCLLLFSYLLFLKFYQLVVHFKLLFLGDILLGEPSVYLLTTELGLLAVCELLIYSIHLKMICSSSLFCLPPLLPFFSPPFCVTLSVCVRVRAWVCLCMSVCFFLFSSSFSFILDVSFTLEHPFLVLWVQYSLRILMIVFWSFRFLKNVCFTHLFFPLFICFCLYFPC